MIGDRTREVVFSGAEIRYSSPFAATMLNDGGVVVAYTSRNLYGEIVYNYSGDDYFYGHQTVYGYSLDDPGGGGDVTPIEGYYVSGEAAGSGAAGSSLTGSYSLGVFLPSVTALPTGAAVAAFNRPFGVDRIEGFNSETGGPGDLATGDIRWATVFGTAYGFFTILIDDTGARDGTLVLQSHTLDGTRIGDGLEVAALGSGASVLPGAAVLRYGDVALAWVAEADDGSDVLQVQRVDGGGWTIGDVVSFGPVAPAPGERAVLVEALPDGTFVTLLHEGDALILRHHAADGTLLASPQALVTVADSVAPDGPAASVPYAMRHVKEGLLAIVWTEPDAPGSTDTDLWFGYFTADGTAVGEPMRLNDEQAGLQSAPVLTRAVGDRLFYAYGQARDDALGVPDRFVGAFLTVPDEVQIGGIGPNSLTGSKLNDLLVGGPASDSLDGDDGDDWLFGGDGDDQLIGGWGSDRLTDGNGDDSLDGGPGADHMAGGGGNDSYVVGEAGDSVVEQAGEGSADSVASSVSYVLPDNVENLSLLGSAAIDGTGNALANVITGNGAANALLGLGADDVLVGAGGDDVVNGGAGGDDMAGGAGNDRYLVDDAGDRVHEVAGEGDADTVVTVIDYVLPHAVERLTLSGTAPVDGTGNADANIIVGNQGANRLVGLGGDDRLLGNGGDDILIGGTGADVMIGGAGDDRYLVDDLGDRVTEIGPEGLADTIVASVTWTLPTYVERLTLIGDAAIDGTGSGKANIINGNDAANVLAGLDADDRLNGGGGGDRLIGGSGDDVLIGGGGADVFVFDASSGSDRVSDFDADAAGGQDLLDVSAFGWTDFADLVAAGTTFTETGNSTTVGFGGSSAKVRLIGVSTADLGQEDFLFA